MLQVHGKEGGQATRWPHSRGSTRAGLAMTPDARDAWDAHTTGDGEGDGDGEAGVGGVDDDERLYRWSQQVPVDVMATDLDDDLLDVL